MRVYVRVQGAERFSPKTVRNREELERVLDFARIGSETGAPREVIKIKGHHHYVIARYVGGKSRSNSIMRARRSPLWGLVAMSALMGLRKIISG
jgi:hypothetical protein